MMRSTWLEVVDRVLRPGRRDLARCLAERERHLDGRRAAAEERIRAITSCERRINEARAAVFATNDGVVTSRMTDLEREWRRLSRRDPDDGLMELWARIAPAAWIDRKRWRGNPPAAQLDVAIALAADAAEVDAAEAAIDALRLALEPHGTKLGPRVRWRALDDAGHDDGCVTVLLEAPLRAAEAACPAERRTVAFERARALEGAVGEAAVARLPARPLLARTLARAAFVEALWCAAEPSARNPVAPLRALWSTGYVLAGVDAAASVTLAIPPLASLDTSSGGRRREAVAVDQ
jgi:hypothetical protein